MSIVCWASSHENIYSWLLGGRTTTNTALKVERNDDIEWLRERVGRKQRKNKGSGGDQKTTGAGDVVAFVLSKLRVGDGEGRL